MKKWKIAVGACPPRIIYSNIITANTAEEAVRKFMDEEKESRQTVKEIQINSLKMNLKHKLITQEEFEDRMKALEALDTPEEERFEELLKRTKEHIPQPKKKKE